MVASPWAPRPGARCPLPAPAGCPGARAPVPGRSPGRQPLSPLRRPGGAGGPAPGGPAGAGAGRRPLPLALAWPTTATLPRKSLGLKNRRVNLCSNSACTDSDRLYMEQVHCRPWPKPSKTLMAWTTNPQDWHPGLLASAANSRHQSLRAFPPELATGPIVPMYTNSICSDLWICSLHRLGTPGMGTDSCWRSIGS